MSLEYEYVTPIVLLLLSLLPSQDFQITNILQLGYAHCDSQFVISKILRTGDKESLDRCG